MNDPTPTRSTEHVLLSTTAEVLDYCDTLLAELALMLATLEASGNGDAAERWTEQRLGMPMTGRPHRRVQPMRRRRR